MTAGFATVAGAIRLIFGEYDANWLSVSVLIAALALWVWIIWPRGEEAWTMHALWATAVFVAWLVPVPLGVEVVASVAGSALLVYVFVDRRRGRATG